MQASLLLCWGAGTGKDRGHNQDPPISLPASLRRVLPTNWEISEMLGDNPVAFPLWALVEYF